jgi:hypothetical protein
MQINTLIKNIKNSEYNNIFEKQGLNNKYVAYCGLEKGSYYATLDLTSLIRVNTKDGIINEVEKENIIERIHQEGDYNKYSNHILSLLKSNEYLVDKEKKLLSILMVYNNLIKHETDYIYIISLNSVPKKNIKNLCSCLNIEVAHYSRDMKKLIKKIEPLLIKMMEEDV